MCNTINDTNTITQNTFTTTQSVLVTHNANTSTQHHHKQVL